MGTILVRLLWPEDFVEESNDTTLHILIELFGYFLDIMFRFLIIIAVILIFGFNCDNVKPDNHDTDDIVVFDQEVQARSHQWLNRYRRTPIHQVNVESHPRDRRRGVGLPYCGATTVRLNMSLPKMFGKWYPVQASETAYVIWIGSLFGEGRSDDHICPVWDIQPGKDFDELSITVSHQSNSIRLDAFLLAIDFSRASKWLISWPNGEDTLTSVVAIGNKEIGEERYDWMLTTDCDLGGAVKSDWAIFSRDPDMSEECLEAIKAIVDGIPGLQIKKITTTGNMCKLSNII